MGTTVVMETKEQRLQWRDFLSEAVSKSCASTLYTAFDVDAQPPQYARPQLSSLRSCETGADPHQGKQEHQEVANLPHIVAPKGTGWSPISLIRQDSDANVSMASATSADSISPRRWAGPMSTSLDAVQGCPRLPVQAQLLAHHQDSADFDILSPTSLQQKSRPQSFEHCSSSLASPTNPGGVAISEIGVVGAGAQHESNAFQWHSWPQENRFSREANELLPPP